MDQTKTAYSSKVQIAVLSFGFGLVETRVCSGGVCLEEFEPAQTLLQSTVVKTLAVVWPLIRELKLTLLRSSSIGCSRQIPLDSQSIIFVF